MSIQPTKVDINGDTATNFRSLLFMAYRDSGGQFDRAGFFMPLGYTRYGSEKAIDRIINKGRAMLRSNVEKFKKLYPFETIIKISDANGGNAITFVISPESTQSEYMALDLYRASRQMTQLKLIKLMNKKRNRRSTHYDSLCRDCDIIKPEIIEELAKNGIRVSRSYVKKW